MGEEFYAIIKLVSGEEIFSLVMSDEVNDDTVIVLQNPVIINMFNSHEGSYIKVKPWIELSNEDFFILKMDKVLYITESKDKKLINELKEQLTEMKKEMVKIQRSITRDIKRIDKREKKNAEEMRKIRENGIKIVFSKKMRLRSETEAKK